MGAVEPAAADAESTDADDSTGRVSASAGMGEAPQDAGDGPRLDLGTGAEASTASGEDSSSGGGAIGGGCSAVDVLIVVDNTFEMVAPQMAFIEALPAFVDELAVATSAGTSLRYMVVDTDARSQCTDAQCADPSDDIEKLCVLPGGGYACDGHFVDCDHTLGAGVVDPAGAFATNQECDVIGPKRWLGAEDADPVASLVCMGQVGIAGVEHSRPMDAMQAALSDEQLAAAGCNAGFLREDALLVVVFISNDPCAADAGKPSDWYATLAGRVGDPQDVVVVGFVPGLDGCTIAGDEPPGCGGADGVVDGAPWAEFVALWQEHGVLADVCDHASYPDALAHAAEVVGNACVDLE